MIDWFFATLKQYPEIAIFLTLAIGYYFGKFTFKGIGLGSVTATLLAGVLIGQIGITISQPLKATVFLMFLFAVGYAVGPQFVRGVAKDGLPQALFSVVQCVLCLLVPVAIAKIVGYDLGYAAGLYSGSQTISAAMGLSTDAINRLGPGRRAGQGPARLDAGRLRGDLHVRHDRLGDRDRGARPEAPRHQSRGRLQGLRGEAGRRQGNGRRRLGLAPLGSARVPREAGRQGRRPARQRGRGAGPRRARLRPAHPPQREDRGGHRGHGAPGRRRRGGRRRARGAREGARRGRDRGRGSRAADRADRGRRRLRHQQGRRRQDAGRAGADAGRARRLPAQDHARRDRHRHPDPAEHDDPARRPPDDRRPHAGHQHGHQAARRRRSRRPTSPTSRSSALRS